jgi:pilus assembly protein Flp/PilA
MMMGRLCAGKTQAKLQLDARIIRRLIHEQTGVTAIEYALIAALIAVAAIGAFTLVGTDLSNTFSNIASCL